MSNIVEDFIKSVNKLSDEEFEQLYIGDLNEAKETSPFDCLRMMILTDVDYRRGNAIRQKLVDEIEKRKNLFTEITKNKKYQADLEIFNNGWLDEYLQTGTDGEK